MRRNGLSGITMFLVLALPLMAAATDARLDSLIRQGVKQNPGLQSAHQNWQSMHSAVSPAGALPDPMLGFNLLNLPVDSWQFDREPMTGKQIVFSQAIPFPGKLGLKSDVAEKKAEQAAARFEETRVQLVKNIKQVYYDIYYVEQAVATVRKNIDILNQFIKIAETKYTVGKGLQQDVLRAQVAHSKMLDREITLMQKRQALVARLNALLNRPSDTPVAPIPDLQVTFYSFTSDSLQRLAEKNRPLLKAWRAAIKQKEKERELAKKGYLPDFKVGVAYTEREKLRSGSGGTDFFSGLFSVNVPLYFWKKQRKRVEQSQAGLLSAESFYRDVRNRVFSLIEQKYSEAQKNRRLLELYQNGIIPQANQSLNSAIAGYQTDKVDFLTLLNNQITLFNYQLDYQRVRADYQKNVADLEALTGVRFDEK